MRGAIVVGLVLVLTAAGTGSAEEKAALPRERYHAYWLTRQPPAPGGEYLELLVSRLPIDRLVAESVGLEFVFNKAPDRQPPLLDALALTIATYEKDSVWNGDGVPLKALRSIRDFRPKERAVSVNGKTYRYEECPLADVVRLLERPEGTKPIHRIHAPLGGYEQTARALRLLLREQLRADAAKK